MNPILKAFGTDKSIEADKGVTIDLKEMQITLLRAGGHNRKFSKVLEQKMRPVRHRAEKGLLPENEAKQILAEAYAEAVIIGWSGEGLPPFSTENVTKTLLEFPDFFAFVQKEAENISNFLLKSQEEDVKN